MKILHVGKFYSPIEGGIESINRFVVEALKGNSQRIVSFNNKGYTIEDDIDGIPVIRTSSKGILASQPLSVKYFFELKRCIRIFNPDVIHFHYPNPLGALFLLMSIKRHNKLIEHWHSDVVAQKVLHRFIKPIEHRLLKRADSIIATSPNYAEASDNIKKFKHKITIIPCSIDEDRFKFQPHDSEMVRKIQQKYGNKPIVFFIGRHVEYKGIKFLLEAEKHISSDCVFLIAGKGPLTEELKKAYISPRIHWLGKLDDDTMRQHYYAASVFAFPSITRNEAFGVVLAEAMYCGCPPVTFTIPDSGVNWVSIGGETGLEVPNKDVKAYAAAIDSILSDENERLRFSHNSKHRVMNSFVKTKVAEKYRDLYHRILSST